MPDQAPAISGELPALAALREALVDQGPISEGGSVREYSDMRLDSCTLYFHQRLHSTEYSDLRLDQDFQVRLGEIDADAIRIEVPPSAAGIIEVRFKPVEPGDAIRVRSWTTGPGGAAQETSEVVDDYSLRTRRREAADSAAQALAQLIEACRVAGPRAQTFPSPDEAREVTAEEKRAFLALVATLRTKGEFFEEDEVRRVLPNARVLIAMTEKDLQGRDLYPFIALSSQMLAYTAQREFGARNFSRMKHPTLKLLWGAMLFDRKAATPEVIQFLRQALVTPEQRTLLQEALGPEFETFKKRLGTPRD